MGRPIVGILYSHCLSHRRGLPQVAVKDVVLKNSQDHTHLQRCLAELEGLFYTEEFGNVEIVT